MITLLDARIPRRRRRSRRQRVVRLELHHRPDHHSGRREHFFEQWKLRQQVRLDPLAGLVPRPQPVAEGLDHVIGGDRHVRGAAPDHAQNRREHAANRRHLAAPARPAPDGSA